MQYQMTAIAVMAIGVAAFIAGTQVEARDRGGLGGSLGGLGSALGGGSNSGTTGGGLSVGGSNGVSVGNNGGKGLSASVGGSSGVNASVGGTSKGGLGVNASVGGSSGINSKTTLGGATKGIGVGTTASVGGTKGLNADVNGNLLGTGLVSAKAKASLGGNTLLDIALGVPGIDPNNPNGPNGPNGPDGPNGPLGPSYSYNDMSAAEKAKVKLRCRDIMGSGGYEASLVKLCRMVLAMR